MTPDAVDAGGSTGVDVAATTGVDVAAAAAAIFTAAKKSGRAWVGGRLVWCAWLDGAIVLVTGGPEQSAPAELTEITLADSSGAAALTMTVTPKVLEPGSPEWAAAAALLAERRLNGAAQPAQLAARWAIESSILRLAPTMGVR